MPANTNKAQGEEENTAQHIRTNERAKKLNAMTLISILGILALIIILIIGFRGFSPVALWGLLAAIMVFVIVAAGQNANGKWHGFLVDPTSNRMSLSRLQITLWTILVLSVFLAMALLRTRLGALKAPSMLEIDRCIRDYRRDVIGLSDREWDDLQGLKSVSLSDAATDEQRQLSQEAATRIERITTDANTECNQTRPTNIVFPPQIIVALGISAASFAGSTMVKRSMASRRGAILIKELQYEADRLKDQWNVANDRKEEWLNNFKIANNQKDDLESELKAEQDKSRVSRVKVDKIKKQITSNNQTLNTLKADKKEIFEEFNDIKKSRDKAILDLDKANQLRQGTLHVNESPMDASLGDLFNGDTVENNAYIDLSKVQMFFFTVVVITAYAVSIYTLMQNESALMNPLAVTLPEFSSSMNTLFGISHASYVTVKGVNQPEVQSSKSGGGS